MFALLTVTGLSEIHGTWPNSDTEFKFSNFGFFPPSDTVFLPPDAVLLMNPALVHVKV